MKAPLRAARSFLIRRAWLDAWFPHVPLALAVGVSGLVALRPALRHLAHVYLHLDVYFLPAFKPFTRQVAGVALRGVPATVVGVMQLIIATGLGFRSRLAWIAALLLTATQLTLALGLEHESVLATLVLYDTALLAILLLAGRVFTRSSLAAGTLFALAAVVLLLSYGVLGALLLGQGFAPPITDLPDAAYFTMVTMSTVGYGDILPKSEDARLFVVSLIVLGLTVFATSLTAVIGPLVQGRLSRILGRRSKKMQRVNHFVITGASALAHNTARELLARGKAVLVILEGDAEEAFGEADVVKGDPTDLETLREAGAEHANAVLALSEDDAENAFVILALRELNTEARKVAAVSRRKHMDRVRRVQPDMILAPNVFGGELLAMALSDEKLDSDAMLEKFLDVKPAR